MTDPKKADALVCLFLRTQAPGKRVLILRRESGEEEKMVLPAPPRRNKRRKPAAKAKAEAAG